MLFTRRRCSAYGAALVALGVLVWIGLELQDIADSTAVSSAPRGESLRGGLTDVEKLAIGRRAIAELEARVAARVRQFGVTVDGARRIKRGVEGEARLPRYAKPCDLDCRLSQCPRYPFGHAKAGEHAHATKNVQNFSHAQPALDFLDDDDDVNGDRSKRQKKQGARGFLRGTLALNETAQRDGNFWRHRVDDATVASYQRLFAQAAVKEAQVALLKGGGRIPCTAEPYPNYGVGLREHLPTAADRVRVVRDPEADALQAYLYALNHNESLCPEARSVVGIGRGGIGGILKFTTLAFTWAYEQGAPFVLHKPVLDPLKETLWELLEPFSSCLWPPARRRVHPPWRFEFTPNFRSGKYVPADYRHRGHFWWQSQLAHYMFRPAPKYRDWIAREKRQMPPGVPYIGMHVRHGDKCEGDRPDGPATEDGYDFRIMRDDKRGADGRVECPSFTEFMVLAERLRGLYGIRHIWLATDDSDVVDRARTDPCYAHWDFHFLDYKRINPADYVFNEEGGGKGYSLEECQIDPGNASTRDHQITCKKYRNRLEDTATMVVDLAMLADADAFALSFSSNIGRIIYEIANAKRQCLPPVLSRDMGWCFTDGQIQEGGPYGHLNC